MPLHLSPATAHDYIDALQGAGYAVHAVPPETLATYGLDRHAVEDALDAHATGLLDAQPVPEPHPTWAQGTRAAVTYVVEVDTAEVEADTADLHDAVQQTLAAHGLPDPASVVWHF